MNISFSLRAKESRLGGWDFCNFSYDDKKFCWSITDISGWPILVEEEFSRIKNGDFIIDNVMYLKKIRRKMKIFDQIKKITIEDMALFLCQMKKSCIDCDYDGNKYECLASLANYIEWLESEDELFDVDSETIPEQMDESGINGLTLKINFEPDMDALKNILIDGLKLSR